MWCQNRYLKPNHDAFLSTTVLSCVNLTRAFNIKKRSVLTHLWFYGKARFVLMNILIHSGTRAALLTWKSPGQVPGPTRCFLSSHNHNCSRTWSWSINIHRPGRHCTATAVLTVSCCVLSEINELWMHMRKRHFSSPFSSIYGALFQTAMHNAGFVQVLEILESACISMLSFQGLKSAWILV